MHEMFILIKGDLKQDQPTNLRAQRIAPTRFELRTDKEDK